MLVIMAKFHADKINSLETVREFEESFQGVVSNLQELMWIDEVEHTQMLGNPRNNLEQIIFTMEATINAFIKRVEGSCKRRGAPDDMRKNKPPKIGIEKIVREENEWRRKQQGLLPVEYELQQVDGMDGHRFECWCADLLKKNGFSDVEVTQGSGDQGVDIIAVKDGIRYASSASVIPRIWGILQYKRYILGKQYTIVRLVLS